MIQTPELLERWADIPPFPHAQMLKSLDELQQAVGAKRGVYLVTPGLEIPEATALQLPASEMMRRLNPFRADWFQIVFFTQKDFEALLERREVVDIDGIPQLLELIAINDPHTHVVVAVVEQRVYHWSIDGIRARARRIRDAESDPEFSYAHVHLRDAAPSFIPTDRYNGQSNDS